MYLYDKGKGDHPEKLTGRTYRYHINPMNRARPLGPREETSVQGPATDYRRANKHTMDQVAKLIGVHESSIHRYEQGRKKYMHFMEWLRFCSYYGEDLMASMTRHNPGYNSRRQSEEYERALVLYGDVRRAACQTLGVFAQREYEIPPKD